MKKIINKNTIFGFIIGLIVCGVTVYAVNTYKASEIDFTPTNSEWKKDNGEDITKVSEALDSLYIKQTLSLGELLWVNTSPSVAFESKIINIDLSKYSSIIVLGTYSASSSTPGYVKINVNSDGVLRVIYNQGDITKRNISVKSDKIEIAGGLDWQDSSTNTAAIPTYIIGVK